MTYPLDLNSLEQLNESPAYYIQQGDVIYVEPNDMKKRSTTVNGNTAVSAGFWISVAALAVTIARLVF